MKKFLLIFLSIFMLPVFANETNILPSQTGIVQNVQYIDNEINDISQVKQNVKIELLTGNFKGETIDLENIITGNPFYDINLKKGMKVVLHAEDNGSGVEFAIEDIKRSGNLIWISFIFCGLLIYVGKRKGLLSLISIAFTVLLITHVLSPLILAGLNPIFATAVICTVATALTMYLVGGFNAKSTTALIGTMLSITFAGILASITMICANLNGFTNEYTIFLFSTHPEFNYVNIAIAGIILATLGAVMDVAMSISSTINEIHDIDNTKTVKELFNSGMNVGRDIIGTMANTLILVYIGGSLPLLLLAENIDLQKFINLNHVVTEISSALIGSIAIVICVPFTAIAASYFIKHFSKKKIEIVLNEED